MITKSEYDRVQEILGRPNRMKTKKHEFAYSSLIRCGECGLAVTAEEKVNRYGYHYTYYHCTKRRGSVMCGQRVISLEKLEDQLVAYLSRIKLPVEHAHWALEHLATLKRDEQEARDGALERIAKTREAVRSQQSVLTDLRLRGLVTDEEFAEKKGELVQQELKLRENEGSVEGKDLDWFELSEKTFFFALHARKRFLSGSEQEKREILVAVGSNLSLIDKTLRLSLQSPFLWIEEGVSDPRLCGVPDSNLLWLIPVSRTVPESNLLTHWLRRELVGDYPPKADKRRMPV